MPYDPERHYASASYRTKQLILVATDAVIADLRPEHGPDELVARLVMQKTLPGCYRPRYDTAFIDRFRRTTTVARNALVSDAPFLHNTASELAANAIFRQAAAIVAARGAGWESQASSIDFELALQLADNSVYIGTELRSLQDSTLEDTDVLALFDLPEGAEPGPGVREDEGSMLRFENWFLPFGTAPRPFITYDGRAWPVEL